MCVCVFGGEGEGCGVGDGGSDDHLCVVDGNHLLSFRLMQTDATLLANRQEHKTLLANRQEHSTLLGPTCCVRLHGTTTMLVLVAYSLKPVKLLDPHKRTQQSWPTTRNYNVVTCASAYIMGL